jgi:GNAT superfamily N-acetyltransferase
VFGGPGPDVSGDDRVGLCARCRHCRAIVSDRGSAFYRCGRSDVDARFPRFPRLPVHVCAGFDDTRAISDESLSMTTPLTIRPATIDDVGTILSFIRQLADYERLLDRVVATEARLRESLFGAAPAAEVLLAIDGRRPVGFALFFHNYSTFLAQRGVYLEDLYVEPAARGRGVGRLLLGAVAQVAVERGCGRLEWAVLDWNAPAIGFYRRMGAELMAEWRICRLTGEALAAVGRGEARGGSTS